jgi:nucleoside phosphorylase
MPEKVDMVIHIPLDEEWNVFTTVFKTKQNITQGVHLSYYVEAGNLKVIAVKQERMGRSAAAAACRHILERFHPKIYVTLGIAGCLTSDLSLGDVAYTGTLIDVYDNSKVTDAEDGEGVNIDFEPEFYYGDRQITSAVGFIRTMPELKNIKEYWEEEQDIFAKALLPDGVRDVDGNVEVIGIPKSLNGFVFCGAVSQSENYKARLKGVTRSPLAIETESGPVFDQCREKSVKVMTVRGMSDYADPNKKKLESGSKDAVRKIAANNAATFLLAQLQNETFIERLFLEGSDSDTSIIVKSTSSSLPEILELATAEVDRKLRELSPLYKAKPVGYRLPSPRIRHLTSPAESSGERAPKVYEIVAALKIYKRLIIDVPRTYPDPSLSWAIANGLLFSEIDGKKIIPIVIDGKAISPPRSGISNSSPVELVDDITSLGGEYIFIIDGFALSSKTRVEFLAKDLERWPNARFIFVMAEDQKLSAKIEQRRLITSEEFKVCDVSFSEMATFIESSFELPGKEAEVIALALRKAFSQFSLPAHPAFFAGIPADALAALLMANRRSELVQLAVDGTLSYIVASDDSEIRLSRTTRASFLRSLVIQQKVEKKVFSEADLVAFAKSVSDEFDYGINPTTFIAGFIEKGIIYVDDDVAKISLPFVESYLLAAELVTQPSLAERYFSKQLLDDFDYLTFDLYAELGPSRAIVDWATFSLRSTIEGEKMPGDKHVLLSGELNPAMLRNPARVTALGKRVTAAREALESGASDRDEKVRILDIAERVSEDIAGQQEADDDKPEADSRIEPLQILIWNWSICAILLGSGAESLNSNSRQEISVLLLQGAELISEQWTRVVSDTKFEDIKSQIKSDEKFRSELKISDKENFDQAIDALVDFSEFIGLGQGIEQVLSTLMDTAKNGVIGNSLAKVGTTTKLQALIRGLWLSSIKADAGKADLIEAISDLPDSRLLRAVLISMLIYRVKWKISDTKSQGIMLDAAEAIVKPLNKTFDKGEILRFVARNKESKSDVKTIDHEDSD